MTSLDEQLQQRRANLDELVKLGVDFVRGEMWKPFTVVDRNLYTGQNPASAGPLAEELLKALPR